MWTVLMIQNDTTTRADYQHLNCTTKFEYTLRLTMYSLPVHQSHSLSQKLLNGNNS